MGFKENALEALNKLFDEGDSSGSGIFIVADQHETKYIVLGGPRQAKIMIKSFLSAKPLSPIFDEIAIERVDAIERMMGDDVSRINGADKSVSKDPEDSFFFHNNISICEN